MSLKEIIELIKVIQEPQKKKDEIIHEYIQYIRNNSMINISQSENNHNDNIVNSTYVEDNNVHKNNNYFHEQTSVSDESFIEEIQIQKPIINIDESIIKIEKETINNKIIDNNLNKKSLDESFIEEIQIQKPIINIDESIIKIEKETINNKIIDNNLNKKSLDEYFLKINNQINNIVKKIENPLYIANTKSKYMKKKDFLFKIQNGKCLYCNKNKKIKSLTKEHLIPKSFNGNTNIGNICLVCNDCNAKRGNNMTDNNFIQEILNRTHHIWFYDNIKEDIQSINIQINNLQSIINS